MRRLVLVFWGLALSGCANGLEKPQSYYFARDVATLATPADVRLVNVRNRTTRSDGAVLCAEPSPDVAKALSTLGQIAGKGGNGAVSAELSGGYSTAETVSLLAGRSAAVTALRDGLYRACEAYANGILPKAAYGLILSQYGDVLVTLALAESAAGSTEAQARLGGSPVAPALQVSLSQGSG